jgi:DNA polymerase-3 subunit alpha/error-prone DNA polymerase
MLFQEDIMRAAHEAAGIPFHLGERLRRALGKKPPEGKKREIGEYFIRRALRRGMDRSTAERIWKNIEQFAGYSFCKAHAAVYAAYAWRAAYLKVHFPAEYMTAVMNNHTGMYPRSAYIEEARRLGVRILPPDIHESGIEYGCEQNGLRVGLGEIKGLSSTVMRAVIGERSRRPFDSPFDFFRRTAPPVPEAENLVLAGALDCFGISRPTLMWLCRNRDAQPDIPFPDGYHPDLPDYSITERIRYEYEVLGFTCAGHPVSFLRGLDRFPDALPLSSVPAHAGSRVRAGGIGLAARSCRTKHGRTMGFLTIEDETGIAEVTVPPAHYARFRPVIHSRGPFLVTGTAEERYGHVSILADTIESLSE